MRNEPKPLSQAAAMRAYKLRDKLETAKEAGIEVGMSYVKRPQGGKPGEPGSVTGEIRYFSGKDGMDTMSVTVRDRIKGDRTINLCRVVRAFPILKGGDNA